MQSVGMMIASAKHYLANEQEIQRTRISSEVDIRTLHEIYLPPFKASVEAGVGSVMCSYNKINGIYACENSDTQNDILKGELGFKGWIVSDWNATHSTIESALGGLDMEMPVGV
ncbi:glycoside hydrolase family 3 N-terminal domain-containing protein, partial [Arthrospira platensis SPKY1]|nr:glycoside hydrolase family 3 N-terminal domain-containing protein [Arthrospira platensis SPKY1]